MTENEKINGWTFEETIITVENVMEVENNMFKWDVLRHLRDFTESFKYELEQYRAIGTVEEFRILKELKNEHRKIGNIEGYNKGYAKAIDEFVERLKDVLITDYSVFDTEDIRLFVDTVEEIAEQMKAGTANE